VLNFVTEECVGILVLVFTSPKAPGSPA